MREKDVEAYLVRKIKALGGKAYKTISPGHSGFPDRLVLLPGRREMFVELKAPGKKPTPLQQKLMAELSALGAAVHVLDSKTAVDEFLQGLGTLGNAI